MSSPPHSNALPDGTRIGRTALRVSDLEETTDFYRTVVGLETLDWTAKTATLGVDGTALLVLEHDPDAPDRQPSEAGLYHNAFRVPSRGALGDALARIRDRWRLDGASDHRVSEALYLTDPEGNGVELYRDRPREEWPRTDDGGVGMGTDPLDLGDLAADAAGETGVPPGTDVGHVHLEVSSLSAFHEFYVETLGFEVRASGPEVSFVAAGDYHHHLGANTWNDRTTPARGRGLAWFEVVLPDAHGPEPVRDRVAGHGTEVRDREGGSVLEVVGPDEVTVRLRASPPR